MAKNLNWDKLKASEARFIELEGSLASPEIIADQAQYQTLAKEFADLTPLVETFREYQTLTQQLEDLNPMLEQGADPDMADMARQEEEELRPQIITLEDKLDELLNPVNQEKDRDVIMEIRAGTGGLEAGLFAGDLYRMYSKYAAIKGWKIDPIGITENESGGLKEVVFSVTGAGASKHLKWESGIHRVQRVPETEASGRIHTSAATVAVLFEPEEVDLEIDPQDLKIDVFRASGPGGQSVNTTDSAVRITHIPTGVVVSQQDEKSQHKNKAKAMRVLRARILDQMQQEASAKESAERKAMVGSGDRSEKIRTYNFPDRRVTDHRIGFTVHKLPAILDGDLDEVTEALIKAEMDAVKDNE